MKLNPQQAAFEQYGFAGAEPSDFDKKEDGTYLVTITAHRWESWQFSAEYQADRLVALDASLDEQMAIVDAQRFKRLERRLGDRRHQDCPVAVDRRAANERRTGMDRRAQPRTDADDQQLAA